MLHSVQFQLDDILKKIEQWRQWNLNGDQGLGKR